MLESLLTGVASEKVIEYLARWRAHRGRAYATALVIVAIATLVRWVLEPHISGTAPFITYFVGILVVALAAGLGPALLAIACFLALAWYLFIPPYFSFALSKGDPLLLVIFAIASAIMAMLVALVNSIVERLLQQRKELAALREREAQAQQLMIGELQHRTANLFAHVKFLASKSFADPSRLIEDRLAFLERIDALAASIRLRSDSGTPTLSALLQQVLKPHENRIQVDGCDVELTDQALQQFALITHELQTNAVKHGGLSNSSGRVLVVGRIDSSANPATFQFLWQETGGPVVKAPHRHGFGRTTIVDGPRHQGATATVDYDPQGFCYRYSIPLSEISAPGASTTSR